MGAEGAGAMGLWTGIAYIVGTIIGSGIYSSPGGILEASGSGGASLLVWAAAGGVSALGSMCYVELGVRFKDRPGGEATYLREQYGDMCAFLYTFSQLLVVRPTTIALICVIFGQNVNEATGLTGVNETAPESLFDGGGVGTFLLHKLAALLGLLMLTVLNVWSPALAGRMQSVTTFAKLAVMVVMIVWMVPVLSVPSYGEEHRGDGFDLSFNNTSATLAGWSPAFMNGLWAYDGWNGLAYLTDKLADPRDIRKCILIGLPVCITLYLLCMVAYIVVLGNDAVSGSGHIAVDYWTVLAGEDVGPVIACGLVAMSTFGAANGTLFSAYRLCQGAAVTGAFSAGLATSLRAILFQATLAVVYLLFFDFDALLTVFGVTQWIFYLLIVGGVFVVRQRDASSNVGAASGDLAEPLSASIDRRSDASSAAQDVVPFDVCVDEENENIFVVEKAPKHQRSPYDSFTYRAPAWFAVVFCTFAVGLVVFTFVDTPYDSLIGVVCVILGVPIFYSLPPLRNRCGGRVCRAVLPVDPDLVDPEARAAAELVMMD
eukprot:TRINITY_DN25286_c0_g1_i1.p1 TRINITY_DN25286_c0_g1~~TRINITY_DN25286_c0_g1_i1.p1  ORF type:complete len:544 (+),score=158.07 TRINITY_DN25286_c0_g1_i1:58-1689(+)